MKWQEASHETRILNNASTPLCSDSDSNEQSYRRRLPTTSLKTIIKGCHGENFKLNFRLIDYPFHVSLPFVCIEGRLLVRCVDGQKEKYRREILHSLTSQANNSCDR
jgi:hypothetical protein